MVNDGENGARRARPGVARAAVGVVVALGLGVASLLAAVIGNVSLVTDSAVISAIGWFCAAALFGLAGAAFARAVRDKRALSLWLLVGIAPAALLLAWSVVAVISRT